MSSFVMLRNTFLVRKCTIILFSLSLFLCYENNTPVNKDSLLCVDMTRCDGLLEEAETLSLIQKKSLKGLSLTLNILFLETQVR